MVSHMKVVATGDQELSMDERNLLSVAYKNVVGARRASWRIVTSVKEKEVRSAAAPAACGLRKEMLTPLVPSGVGDTRRRRPRRRRRTTRSTSSSSARTARRLRRS